MLTLSLMLLWQNISAPPAPPLKAQTSPLANMFTQENNTTSVTTTTNSTGIITLNMTLVFIWHLPLCCCAFKYVLLKTMIRALSMALDS